MDMKKTLKAKWKQVIRMFSLPATEENVDKMRKLMLDYLSIEQKGSALVLQGQEPPNNKDTFIAEDVRVIPDKQLNLMCCAKVEVDWKKV